MSEAGNIIRYIAIKDTSGYRHCPLPITVRLTEARQKNVCFVRPVWVLSTSLVELCGG